MAAVTAARGAAFEQAPSALSISAAPAVIEAVAAGADAHRERLARVGVDEALRAEIRARRQALLAATIALSIAEREQGEASLRRSAARAALVEQARLVEAFLAMVLPPDARAGLRRLRVHCLPRKSRGAPRTAP